MYYVELHYPNFKGDSALDTESFKSLVEAIAKANEWYHEYNAEHVIIVTQSPIMIFRGAGERQDV